MVIKFVWSITIFLILACFLFPIFVESDVNHIMTLTGILSIIVLTFGDMLVKARKRAMQREKRNNK